MIKEIYRDWVLREGTVGKYEEEKLNDKGTNGGYQACNEYSPKEV